MNIAILDLAFSTIGLLVAVLLFHRVRQEQKKTRMLEHEYALGAIRDELFWLVVEGRLSLRSTAYLSLASLIDALIDAKDDLGLELHPLARALFEGEGLEPEDREHHLLDGLSDQEILVLGQLSRRVGCEALGMIRCNSVLASLADWTLPSSPTRTAGKDDARSSRLRDAAHTLSSVAQYLSSTRPGALRLGSNHGLSLG